MRTIIIIVLAILAIAGAYTAYGVMMFEPQKPAPLVFNEPDPATLQTLFAETDAAPAAPLTPAQQQQTTQAVQQISNAMSSYQARAEQAGTRLKGTVTLLNALIGSGKLPAYYLNATDAAFPARSYQTLNFDPKSEVSVTENKADISCQRPNAEAFHVMVGDDTDNKLTCPNTGLDGADRILLGGPGNDTITHGTGNRIVNTGSGDDVVTLGPGRSIIILEEGWGQDQLNFDCTGSEISQGEIPKDFPVPWMSKYTNFIVLSPRIQPGTTKWDGNLLTHTETGDTLRVNESCFTFIDPGL